MDKLIDELTKLETAEYRLSESKSELFKTEIEWIGHKIDQNGIRPLQEYIETHSAQTDILNNCSRKILSGVGRRNTRTNLRI